MSIFRDFDSLRNTVDTLMGSFDAGLRGGRGRLGGFGGLGGWDEDLLDVPLLMGDVGYGVPSMLGGVGPQARLGGGVGGGMKDEEMKTAEGGAGTQLQTRQAGHLQPTFRPDQAVRARVNIEEKDKCYAVTAELPGFDKQNIKVNITDDNVLHIRGEQSQEWKEESKDKRYLRAERTFANVVRNLKLPTNITKEGIAASYVNGVLHIDVPKSSEVEQKKSEIQIN